MEKILVRNFENPTNIYIIGCYFEEWKDIVKEAFSITDDYMCLDVKNIGNGRESMFDTDGCVFILSEDDFIKFAKLVDFNNNYDYNEAIFIENYIGDINLIYILDEEKNLYLKEEDFDFEEYLMYQDKAQNYEYRSYYLEINAPQGGYKNELRIMFSDKKYLFKSFELDNYE